MGSRGPRTASDGDAALGKELDLTVGVCEDKGRRRALVRDERGQATIEFAIVVPLVLLLIVGMIEFAKAFNYWIDLNHLANEGARWAVVDKVPTTAWQTAATPTDKSNAFTAFLRNQATTGELQTDLTVSAANPNPIKLCAAGAPQIGDPVTVTVSTPYSFPLVTGVIKVVGDLFGSSTTSLGTITLSGKATQRLEQVPSWANTSGC